VALFVNRAGNRDKHMQILTGTTLTWLAALGARKSLKDNPQAVRDQINARTHVCEIKAAVLPAMGSQQTANEWIRLGEGIKAIAVLLLPRLTSPPISYPVRPAHSAPTAEATAL
jgi:hypothetical protein